MAAMRVVVRYRTASLSYLVARPRLRPGAAEAALDGVAVLVDVGVEGGRSAPGAAASAAVGGLVGLDRDRGADVVGAQPVPVGPGGVGPVRQNPVRAGAGPSAGGPLDTDRLQHGDHHGAVPRLPGREQQGPRSEAGLDGGAGSWCPIRPGTVPGRGRPAPPPRARRCPRGPPLAWGVGAHGGACPPTPASRSSRRRRPAPTRAASMRSHTPFNCQARKQGVRPPPGPVAGRHVAPGRPDPGAPPHGVDHGAQRVAAGPAPHRRGGQQWLEQRPLGIGQIMAGGCVYTRHPRPSPVSRFDFTPPVIPRGPRPARHATPPPPDLRNTP